ncbi:extracellular solute-binding protein [Candidatus Parcubacteria bacterium]|nr:extracellular solute-binding protein [Candidatus Parcubacteria bacterium]
MQNKKIHLKILLLILVLLASSGFRCKCVSPEAREALKPITLSYWRTWDSSDDFSDLIQAYQNLHPNITINYKKLRYEEYERLLLEAWAEDRGPDIFSIHNTWGLNYKHQMSPIPNTIEMPYIYYKNAIPGCDRKKEQMIEFRKTPLPSLIDIKNSFAEAVYPDVIFKDDEGKSKIYALPLSLDTLVLFHNRDLLNRANIPYPPADWEEFIENTRALIITDDEQKEVIQAGAALGTFNNVERAFDIIALLMMQNGSDLNDLNSDQAFEALNFYLDFASPGREIYTWNNDMPNSLDAFAQGQLAFFFGYSYHIPIIKSKSPTLNFAISPMIQINKTHPINYANYWIETVSKKSEYAKEAWDFLIFAADEKNVVKYLNKTKKPAALRSLIKEQEKDPLIKPFAMQILTAESWHNIKNFNYAEEQFSEMFKKIYGAEDVDIKKLFELTINKIKKIN